MTPSIGRYAPTWAKCAVLAHGDGDSVGLITMDMIGADGGVLELAYLKAVEQGLDATKLKFENTIMGGSHSHSGPGAVSGELLWQLAPATDILDNELRIELATNIGKCLVQAQQAMKPAKLDITYLDVGNVTHNRRAHISPYVKSDTVDRQFTVIKIADAATGDVMAAIWNFAIHGICFGEDNLYAHGDIMGQANTFVEEAMKGTISMFFNSDAGDVTPAGGMCNYDTLPNFKGSYIIADLIMGAIKNMNNLTDDVNVFVAHHNTDFGPTNLNLTLARVANCTQGGILDVCSWCSAKFLNCDLNLHLGSNWVENKPRFNAIRLNIAGQDHVIVTVPGEALTELGYQIKNNAHEIGFPKISIFGYANSHLGYFAPADEYEIGGYESVMSFWGEGTAELVRQGALEAMSKLKH
jgi:hypothetical protein